MRLDLGELADLIHSGLATEFDLLRAGVGDEEIRAIKSDTGAVQHRFVAGLRTKDDEGAKKKSRFVHDASDETRDAMGDVISVNGSKGGKGWQLDRFRSNPQLLWAHDTRSKPIGTVKSARRSKGRQGQKALVTESELHGRDIFGDDPWGLHVEAVARLMEAGALPGVSVGFVALDTHFPDSTEERDALNLGRFGVLITEAELAELSVVPVPANKNAIQHSQTKRKILDDMVREGAGESWAKEFAEAFPLTLEEKLEADRAIRRRTVTVEKPEPSSDDAALSTAIGDLAEQVRETREQLQTFVDAIDDFREEVALTREAAELAARKGGSSSNGALNEERALYRELLDSYRQE